MRIEINTETESPSTLRALIAMLSGLLPIARHVDAPIGTMLEAEAKRTGSLAAAPSASEVAGMDDMSDSAQPAQYAESAFSPSAAPFAPSTADAAPLPTVPAVPTAGIPMPPGAGLPPVPTVPPVPAPPTGTNPAGVALDKSGLPHDPRIHSATPTITGDGMWRKRRGLNDPALVARIEAELKQVMGAPAAQSVIPFPVAPSATVGATPVPHAAPAAALDFVTLIQRVTHETETTKMLTMEEAEGAARSVGLPGLAFLHQRPDLVPAVSAEIDRILAS